MAGLCVNITREIFCHFWKQSQCSVYTKQNANKRL